MGLGGILRYCLDSDFCEGPDDQTSREPIMNEMVDVPCVPAQS
jgi:hypothetical protein